MLNGDAAHDILALRDVGAGLLVGPERKDAEGIRGAPLGNVGRYGVHPGTSFRVLKVFGGEGLPAEGVDMVAHCVESTL